MRTIHSTLIAVLVILGTQPAIAQQQTNFASHIYGVYRVTATYECIYAAIDPTTNSLPFSLTPDSNGNKTLSVPGGVGTVVLNYNYLLTINPKGTMRVSNAKSRRLEGGLVSDQANYTRNDNFIIDKANDSLKITSSTIYQTESNGQQSTITLIQGNPLFQSDDNGLTIHSLIADIPSLYKQIITSAGNSVWQGEVFCLTESFQGTRISTQY
jgi:hypothetical protein